jgi:DNA-binding LytR/AlgR family response regulator
MPDSNETPLALIAEDEPLLAASLQRELRQLWPELQTQIAADGLQAVEMALRLLPQIVFFDVRMPGLSGLEAAQDVADRWPANRRLPLLVFVTAFDEYAVQAFEQAAMDYIVKPVKTARLRQTIDRIRPLAFINIAQIAIESVASTHAHAERDAQDERLLQGLRAVVNQPAPALPKLQRIQASVGNQIVIVPIEEVVYFEAADKYVRVLVGSRDTARELLIRTPIKDLIPQLDAQEFWQIHRSTLVRVHGIEAVLRDESGKLSLQLRGRDERLAVSRLYAGLFRAQ